MININVRNKLPPDTIVFDNQTYDNSIIGVTFDSRAIYDYDLMVQELMEEGYSEEDAIDWIDYNTIRSLPYINGKRPIIMQNMEGFYERI